ncbi:RNA polymerase sigma factor [Engelhardtia mirabilis]|uniref:RNA polymerase sigma factor SigM n=1 Tax=Engelhardtia mirabilis TaxID=2528011 RepID=A0A518BNV4_9BACT|nr:RNA polymerase sigma factor SigM [Planctomycetes bacterium Pla133]QDV02986.1 RNA polymerase sigma factor SigM [Planctomycetes bacterium Pla86]
MSQTVEELFERARSGDGRAWSALVDRCADGVHFAVLSAGISGDEADDAEQAAWMILHRHMDGVRSPGAIVGWVATTAIREGRRARRRARSRRDVEELASEDRSEIEPEQPQDLAIRAERVLGVRAGLDRLGSPCRELLLALFGSGEEASYASVGEQLGMAVGSIGPTRARCLAKLARVLDPDL